MTKETTETAQNASKVGANTQSEESPKKPGDTAVLPKEINIKRLSDQLAALVNWRVKLVRMLLTREMSPDLFSEIYSEYLVKAMDLDENRIKLFKTASERIETLAFELLQLKLGCEAGEVSAREYIERKLKVDREMWALGPKLAMLQDPYKTTSLNVSDSHEHILDLADHFEREAPALGLEARTVTAVVKDLKRIHMAMSAGIEP
mgnify:CR=1 FL=1